MKPTAESCLVERRLREKCVAQSWTRFVTPHLSATRGREGGWWEREIGREERWRIRRMKDLAQSCGNTTTLETDSQKGDWVRGRKAGISSKVESGIEIVIGRGFCWERGKWSLSLFGLRGWEIWGCDGIL